MSLYNTYVNYIGDGVTTDYPITFTPLDAKDVKVTVNGVLVTFTLVSPGVVRISPAPASGAGVRVFRATDISSARVVYSNGSSQNASQLNMANRQLLYALQEAVDSASTAAIVDPLTGHFNFHNLRATNVAPPVEATDAVTKAYFDSIVGIYRDEAVEGAADAQAALAATEAIRDQSAASAAAAAATKIQVDNAAAAAAASAASIVPSTFLTKADNLASVSNKALSLYNIGGVSFDTAQGLTSSQQVQAQSNIGVQKKNYIVNGAMAVSQEWGSTAVSATGSYPVDQFRITNVTDGAFSAQQVSAASASGSINRLRVTVTTADTAIAAGQYAKIDQIIEGYRVSDLGFGTGLNKTVTLKFGVRAPAGTYGVLFCNNAGNRCRVEEFTISAGEANTDVYKTITIQADTTGTWERGNLGGLCVHWCLTAGSTFQTTAGVWVTNNAFCTSNQFNFFGTVGNVFELFDVGLYDGSTAPNFVVSDYLYELITCRRYCRRLGGDLGGDMMIQGYAPAAGYGCSYFMEIVPQMRSNPTAVIIGTWNKNYTADPTMYPSKSAITFQLLSTAAGQLTWYNANTSSYVFLNARM